MEEVSASAGGLEVEVADDFSADIVLSAFFFEEDLQIRLACFDLFAVSDGVEDELIMDLLSDARAHIVEHAVNNGLDGGQLKALALKEIELVFNILEGAGLDVLVGGGDGEEFAQEFEELGVNFLVGALFL